MHDGPYIYVKEKAERYMPSSVIDFGGMNINGSPREVFLKSTKYVSLDICDGPGVDIVANAATWNPDRTYDMVLSTELFEHTSQWREVISTAYRALGKEGYFVLTCATHPRKPHSQHGKKELGKREHYQNIRPSDLVTAINEWFQAYELIVDKRHGDIYLTAIKGTGDL